MRLAFNLLAIVVFSCVAASAQTPAEAQNFAKGGLSFTFPKGWTAQEIANDDAQDLVLSRANNDIQIKVFAHKGRITPEKLPGAKKAFIDPYISATIKQFEQMGVTPKQTPDASEISGVNADGVNITASLGG